MAKQREPSHLESLRKLIGRGEQLCDRNRQTTENELHKFKQDLLLLLGSIGPAVEAFYWRVAELDFEIPYRKSRYTHGPGSGIFDPIQAYRTLDEMVGILKSTQARVLTFQGEPGEQPRQRGSRKRASKRNQYSKRDHEIFELIGIDRFIHMGNDELYRRFRPRLKVKLGKDLSYNAFRLVANRIRKRYGLSSSEEVKKTDQS